MAGPKKTQSASSVAAPPFLDPSFVPGRLRTLLALLVPFLTIALQHFLWPLVQPFAWFLSYPAIFFSSWLAGLRAGFAATGICVVLEWWFFIPPHYTFAKDQPRFVIPALIFVLMGVLFTLFHERLRKSMRQTRLALADLSQATAALRDSEDSLRRAQTIAQLGSWTLDFPTGRLIVSDEFPRVLAINHGQPLDWDSFRAIIHPDDRDRVEQAWTGALHGVSYDIEHRIVARGQIRWIREIAQVESDAAGNPLRGRGTVQDITPRRNAQLRLDQIYRANRALSKCNQALVRATDESTLLQQICDIVVQDAGYPLCWVGRAEQDDAHSVRVLAQARWEPGYLDRIQVTWADNQQGRGPTGTCIRTGRKVVIRNVASDPLMAPWREEALRHGYESVLAIPLRVEAQTYGSLTIYAPEPDAFGEDEIALLTELADDLAFGISSLRIRDQRTAAQRELIALNAQLEQRVSARTLELQQAREREGEIGNRIQQSLLLDQPPTHLSSLSVSALSLPTERIDGDFYAFVEPHEGCLDVIVGDVMGKGVPAALLGAATKSHFLKALSHLTTTSGFSGPPLPKEVVMRTHAEIARRLVELESFVTLCYARIDTRERRVDFVDCGHTGIIHFHGDTAQTSLLRGDNLPLGVREEEIYDQVSVPIRAGDMLVFFSDGITEARNPAGELFGINRLLDRVSSLGNATPSALIETIRAAVADFCICDHLSDDLTVVAVRIEEVGAPVALQEAAIRSDLAELRRVREFVRAFAGDPSAPLLEPEAVHALALAANEVASNIIRHACRGQHHHLIDIDAEAYPGRVTIRLHHHGAVFEPPPPELPPLDFSRESGFGLYMLSRSVDEVHYYRDDAGRSSVALVKYRKNHESENQWKSPWNKKAM
jgi:serine phosphatase RsbU (regulator of sigma subunit)/anti-sigma regulatory factor (Ser/Thr protein kinase)/PAS domain-containing protein